MGKTYTVESFKKEYGWPATIKVLELHGHEKIEHTDITERCTYELEAYCLSGTCSNCSGIPCASITLN